MKHFFNRVKHTLTFKRALCILLAAVMMPVYAPQEAEAGWNYGTSKASLKIWEWYRLDTCLDKNGNIKLPVGDGYNRLLLVWQSGDKTYWTKNAYFDWNNKLKDYTDPWGRKDTWCTIVGEECSSVYYEEDLSSFITEDDLGTLIVDINHYAKNNKNGVEGDRECLQILKNDSSKESNRGSEILSDCGWDSFRDNYDKGWDCGKYAGYSLSEVGFKCNGGNKTIKTTLGNGKTYIVHPGDSGNGDNDQWFASGSVIACDGRVPFDDYGKGTKFVVYFGREANYSKMDSTYIQTNNVYKVASQHFLIGTIVVEPGAVLSIEGKCFLNGNIKNYGTIIIQSKGMLCPYRPGDTGSTSGTVYNYGSLATYQSADGKSDADGMAGEGIMIVMPGGVFAETKSFGDLYFEKSAMLENHGTMLLARSIVAKKAQISNMSTGSIYIGYEPVEQYIPGLDTMGSKILNHMNTVSGAYYYLTEGEESYFNNAGTWNVSNATDGKTIMEEANKTANENRKLYVDNMMATWKGQKNSALYSEKGISVDNLITAVERNQARSAVYSKMYALGLVDNQTSALYNDEYLYLKKLYDDYQSEYKTMLEKQQQAAMKKYPYYAGLSVIDVQQNDAEYLRECYISNNLLTLDEYVSYVADTYSDLYNKYNEAKEKLEAASIASLNYIPLLAAYQLAENAYTSYYTNTYLPLGEAVIELWFNDDDTKLNKIYAKYVLEVEAEARVRYPDVSGQGAASAEALEAQTTLDVANCKAYILDNYKTITEYRLTQQENADAALSAMNTRLATTDSDAYKAVYTKKGWVSGGKFYDKASYAVFGYLSSWDNTTNWAIDCVSHKSGNTVVYDDTTTGVVWKGMTKEIVKSYVQNEIDEYKKNTYNSLMAAFKDETKLHDMYTAYCKELVENAQKLYPKANAQEIYDSINTALDLDELAAEMKNSKLTAAEMEVAAAEQAVANKKSQLEMYTTNLEKAQNELAKHQRMSTQSKTEEECEEYAKLAESDQAVIRDNPAKIEKIKKELAELEKELEEVRQKAAETTASVTASKAETVDAVSLARTTYYKEAKAKYIDEISKLNSAIKTAQETYEKSVETFNSSEYEAKRKELNDEIDSNNEQIGNLNVQYADLQLKYNQTSSSKVRQNLAALMEKKLAEIETLKATNKSLQLQLVALKGENVVNTNKAALDAAQKAYDDYLARLELDARALYPSKTMTAQDAKTAIERYRAEFSVCCKKKVDSYVLSAQQELAASGSTKVIDLDKTYSEAQKYYEAKAKDYYPDYKEGYTFPSFEVSYYANECIYTYAKTKTMIYYKG